MQRQQLISQRLTQAFAISHLDVINESHNHRSAPNAETHFKCVIVSTDFVGKRAVQRHQAVYALLQDEMAKGLHALALHTYTPEEWAAIEQAPASPACQHKKGG
ncbi:BolA family protein [Agitococcus lubricus]|uniref:BolA protein family transcriptional regulator n=1 Tax=Agitococcus lubricus TaxID=1077255 RepID=A0A2T5IWY7_9GAMM|nr:BolA family protein [Agitococcus lubricus]PTQ88360.1 BolA protein family transcriptional regulator [Agitococcus lubricus]